MNRLCVCARSVAASGACAVRRSRRGGGGGGGGGGVRARARARDGEGGTRAAALYRDVGETASHLGGDATAYEDLVGPLVDWLDRIVPYVLGPMRSIPRM